MKYEITFARINILYEGTPHIQYSDKNKEKTKTFKIFIHGLHFNNLTNLNEYEKSRQRQHSTPR